VRALRNGPRGILRDETAVLTVALRAASGILISILDADQVQTDSCLGKANAPAARRRL
jgi:hypothetical protein